MLAETESNVDKVIHTQRCGMVTVQDNVPLFKIPSYWKPRSGCPVSSGRQATQRNALLFALNKSLRINIDVQAHRARQISLGKPAVKKGLNFILAPRLYKKAAAVLAA
jgi:hypothetical protein